ncbi:MAG: MerR family transcriptional regulator [Lachnospiraceae bacterium]|nr:MerR family transcriptional regulator [Lachnospiraceae bacterium]
MKDNGTYTSGAFAKKAHVTKKTLRYYAEHGFLTPSAISENGSRIYSEKDFERIQRILLLKYLGFSLEEIKNTEPEKGSLISSLEQQMILLEEKIKQMNLVKEILQDTMEVVRKNGEPDWTELLKQVTETGLKESLLRQYVDTSNISVRIRLHSLYSQNKEKWFPWIFKHCGVKPGQTVLELGCGNGDFWIENMRALPKEMNIMLSDNSKGVLVETKNRFAEDDGRFSFMLMDMEKILLPDSSVDIVIANHVLFYASDILGTLKEIKRVLKPGGTFICSTYGPNHMKEINDLARGFDDRIVLAAKNLYEIFGKTNGNKLLEKEFVSVDWCEYKDSLYVTEEKDLTDYIVSCHGNQNQYIVDNYKEFKDYVRTRMGTGFYVTKEAGIFICR